MEGRTDSAAARSRPPRTVDILGVRVTAITVPELHACLREFIEQGRKALVLHANAHALNIATEQDWYREFLNSADIVFCDGAGIQLAAILLRHRIPQRITYADWMWQLAELCEREGYSLFLLGGRAGVANAAADRLLDVYPRSRIVGCHHGYFDKRYGGQENLAVVATVNSVAPDILIVGFGMPLQEEWLKENLNALNAKVVLTGGAVFDYVSGRLRRAPAWMTRYGLEWLGRLLIEPRRLWQRYLLGNPKFLWKVLCQRWSREP